MPNGHEMIDQLTFEKQIERWSDPEKFIAKQVYAINCRCTVCLTAVEQLKADNIRQDGEIKTLQDVVCTPTPQPIGKKQMVVTSAPGIVALLTAAALAVIEFFKSP